MMTSTASPSTASRIFDTTQVSPIPPLRQAGATLQAAFSGYQPASTQGLADKAGEREKPVLDYTLEGVATSVADLRDSTRHALDDLAAKIRGIKVDHIKIDGYDPVASLLGDARAKAVVGYLSVKGVDKDLMWPEGHWRKPWDRDFKLADKHCVVIKVYGPPAMPAGSLSV